MITEDEKTGESIVIPKLAGLRLMATFLPYIVILAQTTAIISMYRDNRKDTKELFQEQKAINAERKELNDQWREGFVTTYELVQNATQKRNEHFSEDSSSRSYRPTPRQRRGGDP